MNRKQIMGFVTISLIIGGTIYCIKKYKDEQNGEETLTLKEARELVKQREQEALKTTADTAKAFGMQNEEIDELVDEARDEASWTNSFTQPGAYDFYDNVDWNRPWSQYITEEDKVLRFEPNSIQARDHFIKMELAELTPGMQEYQIMRRLFDFQFEPLNDGDETLYSQLADYREEFFGPHSRWNDNVTIGDIITHYARNTDFNIGGGIGEWIIHFVRNVEFNELATATTFGAIIQDLNRHSYQNKHTDTYGLFGLTFEESLEAEEIASGTVDEQVTYEIEFNTFLKSR